MSHVTLAPYTYYKIGGPAKFFIDADRSEDLKQGIELAEEKGLPYVVFGSGSNILISDAGFPGVVIRLRSKQIDITGDRVVADAGVSMAELVAKTVAAGLSGIEWAVGIPGGVGGSVRGNAGCFGGEIKDAIINVCVYDAAADAKRTMTVAECEFGYRDSVFKRRPELIILSAEFQLAEGDSIASQERIRGYAAKRSATQAIGSQSAGCIFKNISWSRPGLDSQKLIERFPGFGRFIGWPGIPAAYCIEAAGLKGRRVGKVEISRRHANYFINLGGATAEEVVMLIGIAKDHVRRKFGLPLEEEIQYIGF